MNSSTPIVNEHKAIRYQAQFLAMIVVLLASSLSAVQLLVTHDGILVSRRMAESKRTGGIYLDNRFYSSPEQRLFNELLPHAAYSRGGVHVIGASAARNAIRVWELPLEQQALIHNYGIAATTFTEQLRFIRYLVEQQRLLRGGSQNNCILIGLSFSDDIHSRTTNPASFFE